MPMHLMITCVYCIYTSLFLHNFYVQTMCVLYGQRKLRYALFPHTKNQMKILENAIAVQGEKNHSGLETYWILTEINAIVGWVFGAFFDRNVFWCHRKSGKLLEIAGRYCPNAGVIPFDGIYEQLPI